VITQKSIKYHITSVVERLAHILQCTVLDHLDLSGNAIGPAGAVSLTRVLAQCPALTNLNLGYNQFGPAGAVSFVGVLAQCVVMTHLNL
jgi:Ran GTPase-activating protein (RanGAP) involved in mRNA processing and transport